MKAEFLDETSETMSGTAAKAVAATIETLELSTTATGSTIEVCDEHGVAKYKVEITKLSKKDMN